MPPIGEFTLMNYRICKNFIIPFSVTPFLSLENPYKLELELNVRNELDDKAIAKLLEISFNIPEKVSSVKSNLVKN